MVVWFILPIWLLHGLGSGHRFSDVLVVREFAYVFLEELPGMPPER